MNPPGRKSSGADFPAATENPAVAAARDRARDLFAGARGSHDWDHTCRVVRLCERIGAAEGADQTVLSIAALLHDIGRAGQDSANGRLCHAAAGARLAGALIADLPLSPCQKENIVHAIRAHRFRDDHAPATLEARILFDADKLDAIGAVGVARAYLFAGEIGARLHNPDIDVTSAPAYSPDDTGYREYLVKLRHIRERMMTATGRRMAEERHAFMARFFKRFLDEIEGRR